MCHKVMGEGGGGRGRVLKKSGESTPNYTLATKSLHYVILAVLYSFRTRRTEAVCFGILRKTGEKLSMN